MLDRRSLLFTYFLYSSVYVNPKLLIHPPPLPFDNRKLVFYICESISVL